MVKTYAVWFCTDRGRILRVIGVWVWPMSADNVARYIVKEASIRFGDDKHAWSAIGYELTPGGVIEWVGL